MGKAHMVYRIQFALAILAYAAVLVVSLSMLRMDAAEGATWRIPVALMPMAPALAALLAFVRFFQRVDELEQRIHLEALAFAFGGTAIVTFGYGFLENVDFPHLSWHLVWPLMGVLWVIGGQLAKRRHL